MIPPNFSKSWNLVMIQLGEIGPDKTKNLVHAREMVLKAVEGEGEIGRADLVMLPVSRLLARFKVSREILIV